MAFRVIEQRLPDVKVGQTTSYNFELHDAPKGVSCGCGCTKSKQNGTTITLTYKAEAIPKQVLATGREKWDVQKSCTVTFKDKSQVKIVLSITVIK